MFPGSEGLRLPPKSLPMFETIVKLLVIVLLALMAHGSHRNGLAIVDFEKCDKPG